MSAASDLIRASIAALPRSTRTVPWARDDAGNLFAAPDADLRKQNKAWIAEVDGPEIAAHIALLASPDVAAAVADLLDAISEDIWDDEPKTGRIVSAMDALEAAITRGAS